MNVNRIVSRANERTAREARTARDREAGMDREAMRLRYGTADRNSPDAVKLQKDLGWKMTDEAAEEYRKQRAAASEEYEKQNKVIRGAQGQLDRAVKDNLKNIDVEWKRAESKFVDVRVWNKQTLEHVYRLPKDIVDTFDRETFNKGDGSFTANWAGGGYNVDVHPRGTNDAYGKELHTMFVDAYNGVKTQFYSSAGPLIGKNNASVNNQAKTAQSQINAAKGQLEGAWANLKESEKFKQDTTNQQIASGAMQLSGLNLQRGA